MSQVETTIAGVGEKTVWVHTAEDGSEMLVFKAGPTRKMTDVARLDAPDAVFQVPKQSLRPHEEMRVAVENYLDPILKRNGQETFNFFTYLTNSVFVTVAATLITLLINAMAAFALSKYRFPGRLMFTVLIVATLLIPASIILVSLFFVVCPSAFSARFGG